eukprot:TRINITY_DN26663_c0_g1_i2.p1 TRINITY_DN26663_c0_g1~~TRINITY_DN26663_c0_g1_i2.p1  ORF type:complete len:479 (-),score=100.60 TRINITY_DN26663_c0_g1_i2:443-1879(-)
MAAADCPSTTKVEEEETGSADASRILAALPTEAAVGAIVCDVGDLKAVFEAVRPHGLARQKAVTAHSGSQKAVHLTIEGAALMLSGEIPRDLQSLMDEGKAKFVPGLRLGAQKYRPVASAKIPCPAPTQAAEAGFKFIELFAGIGGFHVGCAAAGGHCVLASEIDIDSQEAYAMNFGGDHLFGDVTSIPTSEFPAHNILTAGFPCQPFTRRGERKAFQDPRGQVFFEIPRVLKAAQPEGFFLENVWNLQYTGGGHWSHEDEEQVFGYDFKIVLKALESVGYVVRTKMLCASGWVPQKRQRVYLVGFREDLAAEALKKFEWPSPPGGGKVRDVLQSKDCDDVLQCELTETQWTAVQKSSSWTSGGERLRYAKLDGVAQTLTSSYKSSYATVAELIGPSESGLARPRFFTHRECARLMGFPEDHVLANDRSLNRRYTQLGNAVCPPLIAAVARNLATSLGFKDVAEDAHCNLTKRRRIND